MVTHKSLTASAQKRHMPFTLHRSKQVIKPPLTLKEVTNCSLMCLLYLRASVSPSAKATGRSRGCFPSSCGCRGLGTVRSTRAQCWPPCDRSQGRPCSPSESRRRSGRSQRFALISASDFQGDAFILGLLSPLLLDSGRSIFKVMVITSIIFLISYFE